MSINADIANDLQYMRDSSASNVDQDVAQLRAGKPVTVSTNEDWRDAGASAPDKPDTSPDISIGSYGAAMAFDTTNTLQPQEPPPADTSIPPNIAADVEAMRANNDGAFTRSVKSGFGNVFGGIGDYVNANTGSDIAKALGDWGNELAEQNKRQKEYQPSDMVPFKNDYWTNPEGAVYDVGSAIGSSAATAPLVAAVAAVLPESVPIAVAGGAAKILSRLGLTGAAEKALSEKGIEAAKWATSGAVGKTPEALAEGGGVARQLKAEGYTDDEIRAAANFTAAYNLPVLMAEGAVEMTGLTGALGKFVEKPGAGVVKNIARNAAVNVPVQAVSEGATELKQQQISKEAMGQDHGTFFDPSSWQEDEIKAGLQGAVGALGMGGAGSVVGGVRGSSSALTGDINADLSTIRNDGQPQPEGSQNIDADVMDLRNDSQPQTQPETPDLRGSDPYKDMAQLVSDKTGIPANLIYGQLYHESGGFNSQLAKENNNFAGLTQNEPNGEDNKQPDGGNYYRKFDSPEQFADAYANYLKLYTEDGILNAKTPEDYAAALKHGGYYTDSVDNYAAGIRSGMGIFGDSTAPRPVGKPVSASRRNGMGLTDMTYTPEETQQAVRWLTDHQATLQDPEQISMIDQHLDQGTVGKLLNTYKIQDGDKDVPLGELLFPNKFQTVIDAENQSNVNNIQAARQATPIVPVNAPLKAGKFTAPEAAMPTQTTPINNQAPIISQAIENQLAKIRGQRPEINIKNQGNINNAQLAVANARAALGTPNQAAPRPFIGSAKVEQGQNLVNALNAVNTQKFDSAEAAKTPIPSRTEPIKNQNPVTSHEIEQQLMKIRGQQPANIIIPQQANPRGVQAVNELSQKSAAPAEGNTLPTMEEIALNKLMARAINQKDLTAARNIAQQLGRPELAAVLAAENSATGGNQSSLALPGQEASGSGNGSYITSVNELVPQSATPLVKQPINQYSPRPESEQPYETGKTDTNKNGSYITSVGPTSEQLINQQSVNSIKLTSGFDPTGGHWDEVNVADIIQPHLNNAKELIPRLVSFGKHIYNQGVTAPRAWAAKMRERLGGLWDAVKQHMSPVWQQVKATLKEERGNVRLQATGDSPVPISEPGQNSLPNTIREPGKIPTALPESGQAPAQQQAPQQSKGNPTPTQNHINATDSLLTNLGLKANNNVTVVNRKREGSNPLRLAMQSPSRLAERYPKLKPFVSKTIQAHEKIDSLRNKADHSLSKISRLLTNNQDMQDFEGVMIMGDLANEEYTASQLKKEGYSNRTIRAYQLSRHLLDTFYTIANDVHQGTKTVSKNVSAAELQDLRNNQFCEIVKEVPTANNETLVTFKERKTREINDVPMTIAELDILKQNPNVQVLRVRNTQKTVLDNNSSLIHGDGLMTVSYREQTPAINKLEGHIRHFFGDWIVYEKTKDNELVSIESADSLRQAIKKVNKLDPKKEYVIHPKVFELPGGNQYAAVVGDNEYFQAVKKLEDELQLSSGEAQKILDGKIGMKARGRFLGSKMHRTGAQGYEKNVMKVMRRQTYEAARYAALDPWKREMISRFERIYGKWDSPKHSLEAQYVKKYIADVNGDITFLENVLNETINAMPLLPKILDTYGINRPAVSLASTAMKYTGVMKLGIPNVKSALVNLAQIINGAGAMNDGTAMFNGLKRAENLSLSDKKILLKSGVTSDIGAFDLGAGYSQSEKFSAGFVNLSMAAFAKTEKFVRAGTILGAYHKALNEGKSSGEAMAYAKEINQKANGNYAISDTPLFIRAGGPATQLLFQFQKYPVKQLELIGELIGSKNAAQNAKYWLPMLAISGAWAIPGFKVMIIPALAAILRMFGAKGDDDELVVKNATFKAASGNPALMAGVKIGWYGVGSLAGVDISKSTGIGDVGSFTVPKTPWEAFFRAFGPAGSTIYNTTIKAIDGDGIGALSALNSGLGSMAAAIAGEKTGSRDRTKTKYDEMHERILKAANFRTIDEALESDKSRIEKDLMKELRDDASKAIDDYLKVESSNDTEGKAKAREALRRLKVTPRQVGAERLKKRQTDLERANRTIPKKYQSDFRKLQQFN